MQQLFTVTSGRSGSKLIANLLSLYPTVEAYHEFCCTHVQQAAVLHYLGLYSEAMVVTELDKTHGAGVRYCETEIFSDNSNKLSWVIQPLLSLFSTAKFLWLVRDGRRVCTSYEYKLRDEVYVNRWVNALYNWLDKYPVWPIYDKARMTTAPPPLKSVYWPIPHPDTKCFVPFRHQWGRFQRLCWYWNEVNTIIRDSLYKVPTSQWRQIKLEELTSDRNTYEELMEWIGLPATEQGWQLLQRPVNVNQPVNYPITAEQERFYWEMCGEMHQSLGYEREEMYDVRY